MSIAIVLGLIISIISGYLFWCLSISIIFLLFLCFSKSKFTFNLLSSVITLFLLLLIINLFFVRLVNYQDAIYLICFFTGSFLLFSVANEKFFKQIAYILSIVFLLMAFWGILQYTTGYGYLIDVGKRANAIFFTPNTFAASINFILLPVIIFYLHDNKSSNLLYLIFLLFGALLVSQSRGGWVAFIISILFFSFSIKLLKLDIDKPKMKKIVLGFALIFSLYSINELVDLNQDEKASSLGISNKVSHLIRSDSVVSTLSHRFMLYDIAWQQIKEKPFLGHGFHTYQYYQVQNQEVPHIGNATRFTHNDYLQLWMETGILGLLLFISIPIIIISMLFMLRQKISENDQMKILALTIALISFYIQALVDFLFYVPFLIMMYGFYLGYINQLFNKYSKILLKHDLIMPDIKVRPIIVKSLIGLVVVFYLSQSAIAQLSFDKANRYKKRLDIETALNFYEIARRFASYEATYYLVEADIWYHAAKAIGDSDSAMRADKLYEEGILANSYEVGNLFWRAMLHRDMPELLPNAVPQKTVLMWLEKVLYWLPNDQQAQAEYVRTQLSMGNHVKARELLDIYLTQNPDSYYLTQVQLQLETYSD